jgi:hypothetical protein
MMRLLKCLAIAVLVLIGEQVAATDYYVATTHGKYQGDWRTAHANVCAYDLAQFVDVTAYTDPWYASLVSVVPSFVSAGGLVVHPWAGMTGSSMADQLGALNANDLYAIDGTFLSSATDWINSITGNFAVTNLLGYTTNAAIWIGQTDTTTVVDNCYDWSTPVNGEPGAFYGSSTNLFNSDHPTCANNFAVLCLIEVPSVATSPSPPPQQVCSCL